MKKLFALALVLLAGCSWEKVPAGYVGVRVYLLGSEKGVDAQLLTTGRYWIGINEDLFLFPLFKKTYPFTKAVEEGSPSDESFTFQTSEGMAVNADVGVTVHVEKDKVVSIFQTYRKGIDEIIHEFLRNEIRSALNQKAGMYKVDVIYGEGKVKFLQEVFETVAAKMNAQGIVVEDLYLLGNFRLPEVVVNTLNAKIAMTQDAERVENELRKTKAEAQKRVTAAEGEAGVLKARAEGEAHANKLKLSTIDDKLIKYEQIMNERLAIDKWNGAMPSTMCGQSGMMFLANKN